MVTTRSLGVVAVPLPNEAAHIGACPRAPSDQHHEKALRAALAGAPGTAQNLARRFRRAPSPKIRDMLETLAALGQAHRAQDGSYYL